MAVQARPRMLQSHEVGRGAASKDGRGHRKVVSSQRAGIRISIFLLLLKSFNVKRSLNETDEQNGERYGEEQQSEWRYK